MSALQLTALAVVAIAGTAAVLVRNPLRQVIAAGFLGLSLAILFLLFGAPDVALSEAVVSTVVVPLMVLLALAKLRGDGE